MLIYFTIGSMEGSELEHGRARLLTVRESIREARQNLLCLVHLLGVNQAERHPVERIFSKFARLHLFVHLLEAGIGQLVLAAMVVGTRRVEHRLGFYELFGLPLKTVHGHGRLRGTAHHDLLRKNLVALAEEHVKAVDDFFLAGIVPFRFVSHAARKRSDFRHHALLHQGRSLQFRTQGIILRAEVLHARIQVTKNSDLHVGPYGLHLLCTEHRDLRATGENKRHRDQS